MDLLLDVPVIVGAYLMGGCLTGYYLVRLRCGEDIRQFDSGSAGARNVGRRLGGWAFGLTLLGDLGKGLAAVAVARLLGIGVNATVLVLLAVVAGHLWPLQLGWRGGKGLATAVGGILALHWPTAALLALVALILLLLTRSSMVAGLTATACLPLAAALLKRPGFEVAGLAALAGMVLWGHRQNIRALFRGKSASHEPPSGSAPN
jgi:acyl phosphate:glycerol-3-phosphate acyltransferase